MKLLCGLVQILDLFKINVVKRTWSSPCWTEKVQSDARAPAAAPFERETVELTLINHLAKCRLIYLNKRA